MSQPTTLTMGALIDETLDHLSKYSERPAHLVLGADALSASASDVTLTLSLGAGSVNETDLLEFGSELMLVTAKSTDATPVFTVARGYLGTTVASHNTADTGGVNPLYPRYQVERALRRATTTMNRALPSIASTVSTRVAGKQYVSMPADTVRVLEVGYMNPAPSDFTGVASDRYTEIGGWEFVDDVPSSIVSTGKLLRLPSWVRDDQQLVVKRHAPYAWSGSGESATLAVPLGAEDLPVLFAAARLVTGREISRSEIDKVEEWNHEAAIRGGVNIRLLQVLWADFYRRIDEVRGTHLVPKYRPFRKMAGLPQRRPWILR